MCSSLGGVPDCCQKGNQQLCCGSTDCQLPIHAAQRSDQLQLGVLLCPSRGPLFGLTGGSCNNNITGLLSNQRKTAGSCLRRAKTISGPTGQVVSAVCTNNHHIIYIDPSNWKCQSVDCSPPSSCVLLSGHLYSPQPNRPLQAANQLGVPITARWVCLQPLGVYTIALHECGGCSMRTDAANKV